MRQLVEGLDGNCFTIMFIHSLKTSKQVKKKPLQFDGKKIRVLEFNIFSREKSLVVLFSKQTLRFDVKIPLSMNFTLFEVSPKSCIFKL